MMISRDERIVVDVSGLRDKEPCRKVREALGLCNEGTLVDVLTDSEAEARRLRGFMQMSGCIVDLEKNKNGWMLRMKGRSCSTCG
ncbi:MAG: hypothetical protein M0033_00855 [Nitrospiraceae bacterium]|nr:hypothetical protein [Nitrospiraceae bacterium]MDA8324747.1 hypothetical protein [Nitrospiraceae bacterium]